MARKNKLTSTTTATSANKKQLDIPPPQALTAEQKKVFQSMKDNIVTFITGPAGCGKAARLSSSVFTPNGPVKMKDLKIGDEVCSPDGRTTKISGIYPQGKIDYYKITFADGDSVEACGEHLWEVNDRDRLKAKYKNNKRIYNTSYMMTKLSNSGGKNRFSINTPDPLKFKNQSVKINPYVLGCLIGDGSLSGDTLVLTSADQEIVNECNVPLRKNGYYLNKHSSNKYGYGVRRIKFSHKKNDYISSLEEYGLFGLKSEDKFIPEAYKINSKSKRLSLIQGLMDTDGTVDKKSGMASFSTSSSRLAKDFKWIIETLGGICVIKEKTTTHKLNYICHIRYNKTKELFRLSRKKNLAKNRSKYKTKRTIRKIEKIGRDFCQCIQVESEDHLYVMDHCVVTHNTYVSVSQALHDYSKNRYKKIILTRPAIEAHGERLGFLPGDACDKLAPYMMPVMDVMESYLDENLISNMIKKNEIITIPLAFQRGLSFKDAFIVFDEAQNTTRDQMRMFLTRIGENCKVIVSGDLKQTDRMGGINGLAHATRILKDVDNVGIVQLTEKSIVRSKLVADIETKYGEEEEL